MENAIIAIAAVALLAVQTHRNYLMVQAAKRVQVAPVVNVTVEPSEFAVELQPLVSQTDGIDYDRLEEMLARMIAAINTGPAIPYYPPQPPTYIPLSPQPQYPYTISETGSESVNANEVEINGVKGKQFPAR